MEFYSTYYVIIKGHMAQICVDLHVWAVLSSFLENELINRKSKATKPHLNLQIGTKSMHAENYAGPQATKKSKQRF
jgi:hypothetical protein